MWMEGTHNEALGNMELGFVHYCKNSVFQSVLSPTMFAVVTTLNAVSSIIIV